MENITVTTKPKSEFHLIDFGLSTFRGDIVDVEVDPDVHIWVTPEIIESKPTIPASNVFSLGALWTC